ncbi:hypothetical protein Pan258_02190 [Symmachiella dynata]|nr:hypothetical protein Pan258_02190 [Symmachiella dynata]
MEKEIEHDEAATDFESIDRLLRSDIPRPELQIILADALEGERKEVRSYVYDAFCRSSRYGLTNASK